MAPARSRLMARPSPVPSRPDDAPRASCNERLEDRLRSGLWECRCRCPRPRGRPGRSVHAPGRGSRPGVNLIAFESRSSRIWRAFSASALAASVGSHWPQVALVELRGPRHLRRIDVRHRHLAKQAAIVEELDGAPIGEAGDEHVGELTRRLIAVERVESASWSGTAVLRGGHASGQLRPKIARALDARSATATRATMSASRWVQGRRPRIDRPSATRSKNVFNSRTLAALSPRASPPA